MQRLTNGYGWSFKEVDKVFCKGTGIQLRMQCSKMDKVKSRWYYGETREGKARHNKVRSNYVEWIKVRQKKPKQNGAKHRSIFYFCCAPLCTTASALEKPWWHLQNPFWQTMQSTKTILPTYHVNYGLNSAILPMKPSRTNSNLLRKVLDLLRW